MLKIEVKGGGGNMGSLVHTSTGACTAPAACTCGTVMMQARKKLNMDAIAVNCRGELLRFLLLF